MHGAAAQGGEKENDNAEGGRGEPIAGRLRRNETVDAERDKYQATVDRSGGSRLSSATLTPTDEIAAHGHVLTPGRYVGAEAVEDDGEPFTLHTIRKSFAQNHANADTPPRRLAKLLGNTVEVCMQFFNRVTDANEREAAATKDRLLNVERSGKLAESAG